ncbi:hypothetical protein VOLCADRAFT_83928 [Volvox carteri f. nagariensis]|uniref:2-methoxy-6-polyprenyl-1,4-benzoquinol methylase, mitochondrial n=1 Tax=Volvox carteri f. nagariensis TaxID=3068 RepID=D8UEI3_VOLCA|nr:uncharacterized protein VOLCADRAFT_83928 [Volvox carteri f. nagariensis]EFJ41849.1 hypothetical protein VOLCADRAFT_83928 [Volvox carteri f. nagariensis]|eukprot:XP_002957047.1 hypothetical protein VOLCADRAFT_83928 [Volvox carteri f. nagariensis]
MTRQISDLRVHRALCGILYNFSREKTTEHASKIVTHNSWRRLYSSSTPDDGSNVDFGFRQVPRDAKAGLVGQVFSSVASSYDVMNDLMSGGLHRLWKDRLVEALRPFPGQEHLDVAGGTGDVAFRVLRATSGSGSSRPPPGAAGGSSASDPPLVPGRVVVCDINPDMLRVGQQKAAAEPDLACDSGLSFVEGNAEQLPFPDSSFDSYTIAFGIRNVTDRPAALREALRVLKRGGRCVCVCVCYIINYILCSVYDLDYTVGRESRGPKPKHSARVGSTQHKQPPCRPQETFARMVEDAGFRAVTYENLTSGVVAVHSGFKL